jgi:murein DD-endopeptidase MepM/ murein hydrolase activator NlpD
VIAKKGQKVNQGDRIGLVGSTGQSTGPHLHFSVYKNGKLIDPLTVLK